MDGAGEVEELEVPAEGEGLTRARTYDEIYRGHAARYEELVAHEDFSNNLGRTLREIVRWEGKTVIEAGIGTGRVTSLYLDRAERAFAFDRSAHMLAFARKRFAGLPISCARREHSAIGGVQGEIFVEGWSFGHEIIAHAGSLPAAAARLEAVIRRTVKPGGTAIIIETLGTNSGKIRIPHPALAAYYRLLEGSLGYRRRAIRTDYRFDSAAGAARIMGFFFGPGMERRIAASGQPVIPEWTGVWWKRLP